MRTVLGLAVSLLAMCGTCNADEIRIGVTAPLTGPQADFGVSLLNGIQLQIDEVNAAGGINGNTIIIQQEDDRADPKEGTLIAQKYCDDDNVIALIGPMNSGVQLAALPVYSECNMPEISAGASLEITSQGATNIIRPAASVLDEALISAKYAKETLKANHVAVLHDKQAFGQAVTEAFEKNFTELGGTIGSKLTINATDVDFSAVIAQLKVSKSDMIYLGAVMPQLALFAKQMHEQGLNVPLVVPDGAFTPDFIKQAGEAAAENTTVAFVVPPADSNPEVADFAKRYKSKFGNEAAPLSILGYHYGQIMVEALKAAKSPTRDDVVPALKAVNMKTLLGPVSLLPNGDPKQAPVYLYGIKDGDFRLLASGY